MHVTSWTSHWPRAAMRRASHPTRCTPGRRAAPRARAPAGAAEPRGHRWGSPSWRWGSAVGDAHDAAAELRGRLDTNVERAKWVGTCVQLPACPAPRRARCGWAARASCDTRCHSSDKQPPSWRHAIMGIWARPLPLRGSGCVRGRRAVGRASAGAGAAVAARGARGARSGACLGSSSEGESDGDSRLCALHSDGLC